MKFEKPALVA